MIYTLGEDKVNGAISAPFIKTKYLDYFCEIDSFDIIIFTSKKAIISLDEKYPSWINKSIYTVGEKSKELALSKGAKNIISSQKKTSFNMIKEIKQQLKNKKVLYVRAKKVVYDIKEAIKSICQFEEIIAYETIFTKPSFELEKGSIIIFSSPSTIQSFARFYDMKEFKIIVIGKNTAKSLDDGITYNMPKSPSIELCVEMAKQIELEC